MSDQFTSVLPHPGRLYIDWLAAVIFSQLCAALITAAVTEQMPQEEMVK